MSPDQGKVYIFWKLLITLKETLNTKYTVFAGWTLWTTWSSCLATCGFAQSTRQRTCTGGVAGSTGCLGDSFESRSCSLPACIVSCEYDRIFKILNTLKNGVSTSFF